MTKLSAAKKRRRLRKLLLGPSAAKTPPNQATANRDRSPSNRKTPNADLGEQQKIATAGETVPILFGKRVSNKGGVWIQPSLVKAGSYFFKGSFLFPISQGEIVSSPVKHRVWIGLRNMAFLTDQTITISNIYNSAATLAGSPGTCPVLGAGMYCGSETYSYLTEVFSTSGTQTAREDWIGTSYYGFRRVAKGTGDTTNTAFRATVEIFDNVTGADLTSAYWAYLGLPTTTQVLTNAVVTSTGIITGGYGIGIVQDYIDGTNIPAGTALGYIAPPDPVLAAIGSSGSVTWKYTATTIDNQINPSLPATTGTLDGVQEEFVISKYANPSSTPTADNSSYADITFLKVVGDIYDPPEEGSYPTTTRQLSIYYEQGVKVNLYSVNASGSTQGASNQLVDLAMYLFTILKRNTAGTTPDVAAPILTSNLPTIASFCNQYSLHFNGIISESLNVIELIGETAPFFLLSFLSTGGQYRFAPVLPINGSQQINLSALTAAATFTEEEILPGSFGKTYISAADKTDVNCVLLYRENDPDAIGTQQTVQVRYSGVTLDAPPEQFDMTDFCSNRDHAIIYAKHYLARRKYTAHIIDFETTLDTTGLIPTDIIKIERQRISSAGDNRTETDYYQITSIDHNTDGTTSIEASQFPVNGSMVPIISNEVVNGSFTVI